MPKNTLSFKGKVAIVTGSTRGIGKAIADQLRQRHCHVITTGTKSKSRSLNRQQEYWSLDLSDDLSIDEFCKRMKKIARVDILVNNAGINMIEPIDKLNLDHWDKIIKVNLTGAMRLTQEAAKLMKKNRRGGKILNISSIFGVISKSKRDSYSASKAGLIGLTKASALDLAKDRILVNALCPGFTLTDMTRNILSKKEIERLSKAVPLGRFARESEIAKTAVFLCSDDNTYMTGETIIVDGGVAVQ